MIASTANAMYPDFGTGRYDIGNPHGEMEVTAGRYQGQNPRNLARETGFIIGGTTAGELLLEGATRGRFGRIGQLVGGGFNNVPGFQAVSAYRIQRQVGREADALGLIGRNRKAYITDGSGQIFALDPTKTVRGATPDQIRKVSVDLDSFDVRLGRTIGTDPDINVRAQAAGQTAAAEAKNLGGDLETQGVVAGRARAAVIAQSGGNTQAQTDHAGAQARENAEAQGASPYEAAASAASAAAFLSGKLGTSSRQQALDAGRAAAAAIMTAGGTREEAAAAAYAAAGLAQQAIFSSASDLKGADTARNRATGNPNPTNTNIGIGTGGGTGTGTGSGGTGTGTGTGGEGSAGAGSAGAGAGSGAGTSGSPVLPPIPDHGGGMPLPFLGFPSQWVGGFGKGAPSEAIYPAVIEFDEDTEWDGSGGGYRTDVGNIKVTEWSETPVASRHEVDGVVIEVHPQTREIEAYRSGSPLIAAAALGGPSQSRHKTTYDLRKGGKTRAATYGEKRDYRKAKPKGGSPIIKG